MNDDIRDANRRRGGSAGRPPKPSRGIARQPERFGKAPGIDRDPRPHFERNRAARIDFIDENAGGPVLAC
jgi:hypothetical protein